MPTSPLATSNEHGVILSCLGRIRARLWLTRLTERLAIALIWAAALAIFVTGSKLVHDRWFWLAVLIAVVPLVGGVRVWFKAERMAAGRAGMSAGFLRLNAVLMALVSVAVLVDAFYPLFPVAAALWVYPIAVSVLFLVAAGLTVRPATAEKVAIFVDQQVGLKERVSTALEFFQTQPTSEMEAAFRKPVIASAIVACQSVRTAKVGYRRVDSRVYPLAATMVIAAVAVCFVPPMQALAHTNRPTSYIKVARQGTTLLEKLEQLENDPTMKDPKSQKNIKDLKDIALEMQRGSMSEFDANNRIAAAMQAMKEAEARAEEAMALEKSFSQAFPEFGPPSSGDNSKSESGNNMGKQSNGQPSDGQQKASAGAKADAEKAAGEMAEKLKGMSQSEREALAKKLEEAAGKATDAATKASLQQAADAAREGNSEQFAKSMADAANGIAEQGAQASSQREANQAMENIARSSQSGSQMASANQQGSSNSNGQQNNSGQQSGDNQSGNGSDNEGSSGGSEANDGTGGDQGSEGDGEGDGQSGQPGGGESPGGGNEGSQQDNNGSTDFHNRGGPGGPNSHAPINKTAKTFVKIYDEKPIESSGKTQQLNAKINPLGTPSQMTENTFVPGKGEAMHTYDSVLPDVRKQALNDIETQQIPPRYKDVIIKFYE